MHNFNKQHKATTYDVTLYQKYLIFLQIFL